MSNNNQTSSKIAKDILLASPPGQFDLILEDLRAILLKSTSNKNVLDPTFVTSVRAEWELSTGRSVLSSSNDGGSPDGNDSDGCITALRKAMDNYLSKKFSSTGVRAAHKVTTASATAASGDSCFPAESSSPSSFFIAIFAERIDLNNCNAGSWTARYIIDPDTGSIQGNVCVRAHTFENLGNVQLHSTVKLGPSALSSSFDTSKKEAWASCVVSQIKSWEETNVMEALTESLYEPMGNTLLKSLRRVMPVTRTRMDWNVTAHRVVQMLGEEHGKDKFKH